MALARWDTLSYNHNHNHNHNNQTMERADSSSSSSLLLLLDELWLRILDYLADPADWARWSSTCRRFRRLGTPLCLSIQVVHGPTNGDKDFSSCLPYPLFVEEPNASSSGYNRFLRRHVDTLQTNIPYRLFRFHVKTQSRAYWSRNHRYPHPTMPQSRYVHGLAFHVTTSTNPSTHHRHHHHDQFWIFQKCTSNQPSTSTNDSVMNDNDRERQQQLPEALLPENGSSTTEEVYLNIMGYCRSTTSTPPGILYHSQPFYPLDYYDSNDRPHLAGQWVVDTIPSQAFVRRNGFSSSSSTQRRFRIAHYDDVRNTRNRITTIATIPMMIQPRPFLSHNGGWNIYVPHAWESVLGTNVQTGVVTHASLRSTCLYFHAWIQDSLLFLHAQYIVFPLTIPIWVQDQVALEQQGFLENGSRTERNETVVAQTYLHAFLWGLFRRNSIRWYAIRDYFSRAANELERLRYLTRRAGGNVQSVLPPPAREDTVEDDEDEGQLGLTATHAARTWRPPSRPREEAILLHHRAKHNHHNHHNNHPHNEQDTTELFRDDEIEWVYQAGFVDDPDRPQRRPWNNVVHLRPSLSSSLDAVPVMLDPEAPRVVKDTRQPPWSIVFYG